MSDAANDLARRRKLDPPWRHDANDVAADRVVKLYNLLEPNLPSWITERYRIDLLVVGEIGVHAPEAFTTTPFPDGSHAIVISSGYLHVFDAVARDVSAALETSPECKKLVPLLSPGDAVSRIAAWLEQYLNGDIFQGYSLGDNSLPLSPDQERLAVTLSTMAALFTFAHELGHVAADINHPKPVTNSTELDADIFGFILLLSASQRLNLGLMYAGAHFAVRVHACLEKVGFKFKDFNVPQAARVARLKEGIRTDLAKGYMGSGDLTWAWAEVVFEMILERVVALLSFLHQPKNRGAQTEPEDSADDIEGRKWTRHETKQAAIRMGELKRAHPPWEWSSDGTPLDRTKWYCDTLHRVVPRLAKLLYEGDFVIGEVGLTEPCVAVEHFEDGSAAIMLNSGLLSMLTAVSRYLHTRVAVRVASGKTVGSLIPHDHTVMLISAIFLKLGRGTITRDFLELAMPGFGPMEEALSPAPQPLTDEQLRLADELAGGAASFILLSHVNEAIIMRYPPDRVLAEGLVPGLFGDERARRYLADQQGLGEQYAALEYSSAVPQLGFRPTFAAALFAIRFLSCIDIVTQTSGQSNSDRTVNITGQPWRSSCGSEKSFKYMNNVGRFYSGIIESVMSNILATSSPLGISQPMAIDPIGEEQLWASQCIAWWIAGGIGQYVRGEQSAEGVLSELKELTGGLTDGALRAFADSLMNRPTIKGKLNPDVPDHERAQRRREFIDWLISRLPERERVVLAEARDAPWTGPSLDGA